MSTNSYPGHFGNWDKGKLYKKIIPFVKRSIDYSYKPLVEIHEETSRYLVKIAVSKSERIKAHNLRLKVFSSEFIGQEKYSHSDSDWDLYDKKADFLIIIDKRNNEIVGSYRLIRSHKVKDFYTSSEFIIDDFINKNSDTKVELSRACVASKYRKGSVILLLWKGIYSYLNQLNVDILFGCSSLSKVNVIQTLNVIRFLQDKDYCSDNQWGIKSKGKFNCNQDLLMHLSQLSNLSDNKPDLPPLFKSYLSLGAKMIDIPAYDQHFKCYDFFTILNISSLSDTVVKRFS